MANILDLLTKNSDGTFSPKLNKGQRLLFVGRSGSGKTAAEASFPKRSYTADFDNRMRGAICAKKWMTPEEFAQIEFDFYNPSDGFNAYDDKLGGILEDAQKGKCKYNTVCNDSVGALIYCLALDSQRLRGANKDFSGKVRGKVKFLHPDDYNYVSTALRLIMFDRVFPLNECGVTTIFSAWVADKWGKDPNAKSEYDPAIVTGERILGPGNAVEEFTGYFDEQYYFRKETTGIIGIEPKFTVEFNGAFAKSALGLPIGRHDITNKNFYQFWTKMVNETLGTGVK